MLRDCKLRTAFFTSETNVLGIPLSDKTLRTSSETVNLDSTIKISCLISSPPYECIVFDYNIFCPLTPVHNKRPVRACGDSAYPVILAASVRPGDSVS